MADTACEAPDCDRTTYARGHCERHYRQLLHGGELQPERVQRVCSVAACERTAVTRGWCHGHYLRVQRTGDVRAHEPLERPEREDCRVVDCGDGALSDGLCRAHARRQRLYGSPEGGRPRRVRTAEGGSLSNGYWYVPVDAARRHLVPPGRTKEFEHRLVLAQVLGRPLRADETVHHRNGDRLDNRPANLELWSTAQPKGQRLVDKLAFARELLARYDADTVAALGIAPGRRESPSSSDDGLSDSA